jgi:hypothetical protein
LQVMDAMREVYQTEGGDLLFVVTASAGGMTWNEAQAAAKEHAKEITNDDWSKAVFDGIRDVTLHIGCKWPDGCPDEGDHDDEPDYVPVHPQTRCFVFKVVEW